MRELPKERYIYSGRTYPFPHYVEKLGDSIWLGSSAIKAW